MKSPSDSFISLNYYLDEFFSFYFQHQEYEAIYRSFKISQQRHSIRREIMYGRMPVTALQEFDNQMQMDQKEKLGGHGLLASYYR